MEKFPPISVVDIIKILRQSEADLLSHPNRNLLLTFEKLEWDVDTEQASEIDVEVRFLYQNYESITRAVYKMDSDTLRRGPFGVKSPIEAVRLLVKRLEQDGYIQIKKQSCSYHTEYGRQIKYDDDGDEYETTTDAKKYFTDAEQSDLNEAIVLTTKGLGAYVHFKKIIYSEPLAFVALIIAVLSLIVNGLSNH